MAVTCPLRDSARASSIVGSAIILAGSGSATACSPLDDADSNDSSTSLWVVMRREIRRLAVLASSLMSCSPEFSSCSSMPPMVDGGGPMAASVPETLRSASDCMLLPSRRASIRAGSSSKYPRGVVPSRVVIALLTMSSSSSIGAAFEVWLSRVLPPSPW
ncbi:MAG: hypothetical protein H6709_02900 [Kofleriaceae bacterium]|nr:hypothetical protein [Kofleriaceae bacterium]